IELELRRAVDGVSAEVSKRSECGAIRHWRSRSGVCRDACAPCGGCNSLECGRVQVPLIGLIGHVMKCVRRQIERNTRNEVRAIMIDIDQGNVRPSCHVDRRSGGYMNQRRNLPVTEN